MRILVFAMDTTLYEKSRSLEIHLADELARQGHEVRLICERDLYYAPGEKPVLLEWQSLPLNTTIPEELFKMHRAAGKIDVVLATSISGSSHALFFAKEYGCKSVVQVLDIPSFRWHFEHFRKEWEWLLQKLHDVDGIVVNSSIAARHIRDAYRGDRDDRVRLIFYGVDTITPDSVPAEEKSIDIITCHRFVGHKASEKLIYALALMKKKPSVVMIGEGDQFMNLVNLATFAGVPINFVGPVGDLEKYRLLKKSRLAVSTDVCEDIGTLFPLEAMYCEVPVICSDLEINRERFEDHHFIESNTFRIPPFDIAALKSAIESVLDDPVREGFDMNHLRKVKEWVVANRSINVQAQQLIEEFKALVGEI